jgi:hypothetical protein
VVITSADSQSPTLLGTNQPFDMAAAALVGLDLLVW